MVPANRDTSLTLSPYKSSLQPIGPSSCTLLGWFRLPSIDQYSSLLPPVGVWTVSQFQCGGPSSQNPTDRCLGGPLPRQQANQTHPHPLPINLYFKSDAVIEDHAVLVCLSAGYPTVMGRLDTRYSPVRRSTSKECKHSMPFPLDLHVLSL